MTFLDKLWLIPLFPLVGALLMLLGHRRWNRAQTVVSVLCPGAVFLSFLFSVGSIYELSRSGRTAHEVVVARWFAGLPFTTLSGAQATFGADWGFLLDPLSSVMILIITGIGFLIHLYAVGYMHHSPGFYRFFGYLNLFVFFMLTLVLANNYLLLFAGWEGVGLCSYLLIGFYLHRPSAGNAANKAFITNRVGDAGFLLAMLLTFAAFGSVRYADVTGALKAGAFPAETAGFGVLSAIALLMVVGACGKSAQFPLFIWLPDAMEGPTPVSALIHAATMVTAGVYLITRSAELFALTPDVNVVIAVLGGVTALMAATIALVQTDIKRVLAYSTVSQLGYMFMALGAGAYTAAMFHLFTHAFFKALLFLGSGSVIHALDGEQDMRKMGALRTRLPITHAVMFIGSLAIAGVPGLAGFFSKDEILWRLFSSPVGFKSLYAVGLLTALLTAFYMWRMMFLTFYGKPRMSHHVAEHAHESPAVMTAPLVVLAAGSVLAGWIGVPKLWTVFGEPFRLFEAWLMPILPRVLEGAEHEEAHALEWALMGLSVAVALAGILLARFVYLQRAEPPRASGPLYSLFANKWGLDDAIHLVFVRGLGLGGARALSFFDKVVVDGTVNGAGLLARVASLLSGWWDFVVLDGFIRISSLLVRFASYPARILQTGYVQAYALAFAFGVLVLFGVYLTTGR